jgi:outer membrane protein OmpA-like peptidoglycan-associated protein
MRGIRSNRIISKGYGKSKPVATNELMKEDNLTEELNLK